MSELRKYKFVGSGPMPVIAGSVTPLGDGVFEVEGKILSKDFEEIKTEKPAKKKKKEQAEEAGGES